MNRRSNRKNYYKRHFILIISVIIFTLAIVSSSSAATTIYVNNFTGDDSWTGDSSVHIDGTDIGPKATIQNGSDTVEDGGTVYVADGVYQEHVTIKQNLNLIGQSTTGTIIDGTNNGRPLTINSGLTVNLANISIINGNVTALNAEGGGIFNNGTLNMTNCNVINNTCNSTSDTMGGSSAAKGAICNWGSLIMVGCNVVNNTAMATSAAYDCPALAIGGICNWGSLNMTGCNIENNTALATTESNTARAIYGILNFYDSLIMVGCNVANNLAIATGIVEGDAEAHGILNWYFNPQDGLLNMTNCSVVNNTAMASSINGDASVIGGVICNTALLNMIGCSVVNNTAMASSINGDASVRGGVIFNNFNLTANYNRIVDNTLQAIYNDEGNVNSIENNWWGSNEPDFDTLLSGTSAPVNWLYMTINADPTTINNGETSQITVSFNNLFDGTTVTPLDPLMGHIPDGTPVTFNTDLGSIGCKTIDKETSGGVATATLTADETAGVAHVNGVTDAETQNVDVTIDAKSSLYLTVTPSKTNPVVGDTVIYTLKVGNKGPDTAKDVVMTYVVPEGLEFAGANVDVGTWTYDEATRTITWTIGDVPVGDPYMWLSLRILRSGTYLINPRLSTSTYDPTLNTDTQSLTINAATASTTNTAHAATVSMQNTGMPVHYLVLAILMVFGGILVPKRK